MHSKKIKIINLQHYNNLIHSSNYPNYIYIIIMYSWGQIIGPTLFRPTLQLTSLSTERMGFWSDTRFLIMNHKNNKNLKK